MHLGPTHVSLLSQEAGANAGGVQKSVKTGVANALLAMLKCTAAEAAPWRKKVCLRRHIFIDKAFTDYVPFVCLACFTAFLPLSVALVTCCCNTAGTSYCINGHATHYLVIHCMPCSSLGNTQPMLRKGRCICSICQSIFACRLLRR